jgi:hypothetical protein
MRTEWNTFTPGVWQHKSLSEKHPEKLQPLQGDDPNLEGLQKNRGSMESRYGAICQER